MDKIPYKTRLRVSIGTILLALIIITAASIYYAYALQTWALITVFIASFLLFVFAAIMFPKFKDYGTPAIELKPNRKKPGINKIKKYKKPFITDEEWKELDEEDEECMYIDEDD